MTNIEIGKRIRIAREKRGLNKKELAQKIQVADSTIKRYEDGDIKKIKMPVIESIANALHVNPMWIIGKDVSMECRSINFTSTPIDCPFNSALAKLQKNDCNLTEEELSAIKEQLPNIFNRVAKIFDDFYHSPSNLYEKEKAKQLLGCFFQLNTDGQNKAIDHVSLLTKIPEYQSLDIFTNNAPKDIIELVSPGETNRFTYSYYQRLASAGTGEYIFTDIPTDTIEASYMEHADFIIGVNGDSMEPTYYNGDKVYVEKRQIVEIGEIGIFMVNNECFIKEAGRDGLISHNKKYNLIPGSEHIICVGKVLGKVED